MCESESMRILLVDDEQSICSALRRTFKQNHYQVFEANSGNQALDVLQNNTIDVVVSDQRMPGMTGTELLMMLHTIKPALPGILASGLSTEIDQKSLDDSQAVAVMSKPYDLDAMGKIIDEHALA